MIRSWTDHVTALECHQQLSTRERSEAKSASRRTNNGG